MPSKKIATPDKPVNVRLDKRIYIDYTNWRGERRVRLIQPIEMGMYFGSSEHHKEPQWLLRAIDCESNGIRTFALRNIHAMDCSADGTPKA